MSQLVVLDAGIVEKVLLFGILPHERPKGIVTSDAPLVLQHILGGENMVDDNSLVLTNSFFVALFCRGCFTIDELMTAMDLPIDICRMYDAEGGFYFDWDIIRLVISATEDPSTVAKYDGANFPKAQVVVFPDGVLVPRTVRPRLIF